MIKTMELIPGVVLRCFQHNRFKQSCFSWQLVRPMRHEEAAMNSLIPAVLLRGTEKSPDLRSITLRLDDLYGASVGTVVRRIGDYQTTGLYCGFMEDAYALPGDRLLEKMIDFVGELLFSPLRENGGFCADFVHSEKRNLLSAIEAKFNDKRTYAGRRLIELMCPEDSFGVPRLGAPRQIEAVDARTLWSHYQQILRESPMELFYVGSADARQVAELVMNRLASLDRNYVNLKPQTGFHSGQPQQVTETLEVSQGKLAMGFVTDITLRDDRFAAMQVCNTVFGSGMTGKLFTVIREKMSLCYDIGSSYHGSKGIMTVSAGIDSDKEELVRQEILRQLEKCARGEITGQELQSAKQAIIAQLQATHDSPGAIESYYGTAALSGLGMTPEQYLLAVEQVTAEQVAAAAQTLKLHTSYFLKGVS